MSDDARPLTDDERAELEALRREKAAREERVELERLKREQAQADAARERAAAEIEADRQAAAARARGAALMEPDDDLRMAPGQKIVIAAVIILAILFLVVTLTKH